MSLASHPASGSLERARKGDRASAECIAFVMDMGTLANRDQIQEPSLSREIDVDYLSCPHPRVAGPPMSSFTESQNKKTDSSIAVVSRSRTYRHQPYACEHYPCGTDPGDVRSNRNCCGTLYYDMDVGHQSF